MFKKLVLLTLALTMLAPVAAMASGSGPTPDHGHVITQPKADGG